MSQPYATIDDLLKRDESLVWTLATDPNDHNRLDTEAVELAIKDATDEINSFLKRYALPLPSVPSIINRLAISMAMYWLADRDNAVSELVQKRYDSALQTLREISAGKRDLGLPGIDKPQETSSGKVEVISGYRPSMRNQFGQHF
ncbi:gp436 family protein [Vibrio scophthalmi]|uniref:Mu-like prophage FluMu protein gp36 n=1 Tax=Vibrio scophthalmi TaxID=45658 RepID=A0A1E3WN59_9VIBR|nr:DUF1320 domain-containing protein [Vibrio scophthalmi]ODS10927.1 hypothetical protein VSF3289_01188 [Vibrio scophthalmi]